MACEPTGPSSDARCATWPRRPGSGRFFDLGTGLPTAQNTHQVAQEIAPDSRIVYVDNDPIVLAYARALLTSVPEGATAYVPSDIRDTEKVLAGRRGDLHLCE